MKLCKRFGDWYWEEDTDINLTENKTMTLCKRFGDWYWIQEGAETNQIKTWSTSTEENEEN